MTPSAARRPGSRRYRARTTSVTREPWTQLHAVFNPSQRLELAEENGLLDAGSFDQLEGPRAGDEMAIDAVARPCLGEPRACHAPVHPKPLPLAPAGAGYLLSIGREPPSSR